MTPKEKAEAIVDKMFIKLGGSFGESKWNPVVWKNTIIYDQAKKVCDEMVTEIILTGMIDLTDEQVIFWRKVQDEINQL